MATFWVTRGLTQEYGRPTDDLEFTEVSRKFRLYF
jgi:hypothetical protein